MPNPAYSALHRGLNLWGWSAGVNMQPGECLDCLDVLYRMDGAVMKHWGWERVTPAAFAARPLALRSFNYKGKNNNEVANPARQGNLGIAEAAGAAIYTRRNVFYSTAIALTETQALTWRAATQTWVAIPLPAGTAIDIRSKPDIVFIQNNAYIVGWADHNLRFDPVDGNVIAGEVGQLYQWGWDTTPGAPVGAVNAAAGTLVENAVYRYRTSWVDLYTGEESELSPPLEVTPVAGFLSVLFAAGGFADYAGARHWVGAGTDRDVGLVVYRTDPDQHAYYFLTIVRPDGTPAPPVGGGPTLAACTLLDNGLALDYSIKAEVANYEDMPTLDGMCQFKSMIFGFSWDVPPRPGDTGREAQLQGSSARIYYNDFKAEKSFIERWDVRNYKELPLDDGEIITSLEAVGEGVFTGSNTNAYALTVTPNYETGRIAFDVRPMNWSVGVVGPKAAYYVDGWLYFLSDRGPYKWQPGTTKPLFIGKNLVPLFIDPETGLCQMTEGLRVESEIYYDQDANVVRWIFPCGATSVLNRHLTYLPDGELFGLQFWEGWGFCSPRAQCFDFGNAYGGLVGGYPATPFDVRPRIAFGDDLGYTSQYQPTSTRGGVQPAAPATGTGQAGSNVNLLVTLGPYVVNELRGVRLEVVYTDGTIDVRTVAANTALNITPDAAFSQDPTGVTYYIGGIPFRWRSWVDHMNDPASHKDLIHLHVGYNREFVATGHVTDLVVAVGSDWPLLATRTNVLDLSYYRAKRMIARTGRFFTYEVSNSRPDERFLLTWLKTEYVVCSERQR